MILARSNFQLVSEHSLTFDARPLARLWFRRKLREVDAVKNDICEGDNRATRAASRRLRIVETARRLVVTKGFHGTGVAQIAAESGVKIGQLFRVFACKEDIVAQIVPQSIGDFLDESGLGKAASNRVAN
ncbi:MAG: TetR/AcrR family transcriptional regulator, partial [Novosphingobium sp.]